MTTASLTGTDVRLRDVVIRQLDWDPEVDDSAVSVAAKDGQRSRAPYPQRCAAFRITSRCRHEQLSVMCVGASSRRSTAMRIRMPAASTWQSGTMMLSS